MNPEVQLTEPTTPAAAVLFLCTGNYYRSRFAEELFNHLAESSGLEVRATSLGFTPHPKTNLGPMSPFAFAALAQRRIIPRGANRMPAAVDRTDFARHPVCIALCEREHRPMMQTLFPELMGRVHFWNVEDLALEPPSAALAAIEFHVRILLREMSSPPPAAASLLPDSNTLKTAASCAEVAGLTM